MAMRYADEDAVLAQLSLDAGNPDHAASIARVEDIEEGLCLAMDDRLGTSFGAAPVAEERSVMATLAVVPAWMTIYYDALSPSGSPSPRLVLHVPLRSVTSIATGGTWNGTGWDDGETLAAADYRLVNETSQGYYAIDLVTGTWSGVVRITGIWGDQVTAGVPADIREALTLLTIRDYLRLNATPNDVVGPDGSIVTLPTAWTDPKVQAAIRRNQLVRILV